MENLIQVSDTLFVMVGAVMILAMHAGFAFLEVGSVRKKNQVNALNKILVDYSVSTMVYFFVGYPLSRGVSFLLTTQELQAGHGLDLMKFFLYLGFAACIPAIISGGVSERMKFLPNTIAGAIFVGLVYPFVESITWGRFSDCLASPNGWLAINFGAPFHDFAGSAVVHSLGGWLALPAVILLGARLKRYETDLIRVSSIPFLALGSWILIVGWFGFNVMSAGSLGGISGLVAINSLMATVGGVLVALVVSRNDAGFVHNGALAGLVAVCAGSDIYHPVMALVVGGGAGLIFVVMFRVETEVWKIDDVLGVWPLHGLCGTWGAIATGLFGQEILGGLGGVSFYSQIIVAVIILLIGLLAGTIVYGVAKYTVGIRLSDKEEIIGSDRSVHGIDSNPEESF